MSPGMRSRRGPVRSYLGLVKKLKSLRSSEREADLRLGPDLGFHLRHIGSEQIAKRPIEAVLADDPPAASEESASHEVDLKNEENGGEGNDDDDHNRGKRGRRGRRRSRSRRRG